MREPNRKTFFLLSVLAAAIMSALVGGFWAMHLSVPRRELLYPFSPPLMMVFFIAVILAHELLHIVVFPDFKRSVVGLFPGGFAFFAHYEGPLTRRRFLLCAAMPLIVLTVLPVTIALVLSFGSHLGAALSTWNAMFACVDILGIWLVAREIPAGALLRNQGLRTYWKGN